MAPLEPNLLEEGILVHGAQRIAAGEALYRDVLVFTGPLPFELLAMLFRVAGESLVIARAAVVLLHAVATFCACGLAHRSGRAGGLHLIGALMTAAPVLLFPLLSTYYYSTIQLSVVWISAYAALRGIAQTRWAVTAGVLVAAAALCKQQVGPLLAVGFAVVLGANASAQRRWRAPLELVAGGAAVAIASVGVYAAAGLLEDVVAALVLLPLSFEASFDAPFVNLWPVGRFDERIPPSQIAFYLPYFYALVYGQWGGEPGRVAVAFTQFLYALPFAALAATLWRRTRGPLPAAAWIQGAVLVSLVSTLFPRTDWGHLVFVLPSAAVQLVLIWQPIPAARAVSVRVWWGVTALVVPAAAMAIWLHSLSGEPTFGPKVPLRPVSGGFRTDAIPRALQYIRDHTEPGDAIFVPRAEPLVYFATETTNPTPYPGVIPGLRDEQERVIIAALANVRYVVMSDIDQPVYTYYRDELPAVQAFLERHFEIPPDYLADGPNWMLALQRGPDRGATAIDLIDNHARGDARSWTQGEAGPVSAPVFQEPLAGAQNRRFLPLPLGALGGGVDFVIEIPPGAVFQADVGYPVATGLERVYKHPTRGIMTVSIRRSPDRPNRRSNERGNEFEVISATPVRMSRPLKRRWTPVVVDLQEYAGERVTLRLSLVPEVRFGARRLAWWGSPRIARVPESGS